MENLNKYKINQIKFARLLGRRINGALNKDSLSLFWAGSALEFCVKANLKSNAVGLSLVYYDDSMESYSTRTLKYTEGSSSDVSVNIAEYFTTTFNIPGGMSFEKQYLTSVIVDGEELSIGNFNVEELILSLDGGEYHVIELHYSQSR